MSSAGAQTYTDNRSPPALGRIPFPSDIIGSVLVSPSGEILSETYVSMPAYRVVVAEEADGGGVMRLEGEVGARLIRALEEEERNG